MKPLNYALTLSDMSPELVHKYVGQEPSGKSFNELTLDYQRKSYLVDNTYESSHEKACLMIMLTTKVQNSLQIFAV